MGAGIQRWWRSVAAYQAACNRWRAQQRAIVERSIIVSSDRSIAGVRRVLIAQNAISEVVEGLRGDHG